MPKTFLALLVAFSCVSAHFSALGGGGMSLMMRRNIMAAKSGGWVNPYVTDGLVAMWDGEWNAGPGVHDDNASKWMDLTGSGIDWSIGGGATWNTNSLHSNNAVCGLLGRPTPYYETLEIVASKPEDGFRFNAMFLSGTSSAKIAFFNNTPHLNIENNAKMVGFSGDVCSVSVIYNSSDNAIDGYCNNVFALEPKVDGWGIFSYEAVLGGRYATMGNSSNAFLGNIYCIRLYGIQLDRSQIAANYAVDKARFNLP